MMETAQKKDDEMAAVANMSDVPLDPAAAPPAAAFDTENPNYKSNEHGDSVWTHYDLSGTMMRRKGRRRLYFAAAIVLLAIIIGLSVGLTTNEEEEKRNAKQDKEGGAPAAAAAPWTMLGPTIHGDERLDYRFGAALAISNNGLRVAAMSSDRDTFPEGGTIGLGGRVRVFDRNANDEWEQNGDDLLLAAFTKTTGGQQQGLDCALSGNGETLVIMASRFGLGTEGNGPKGYVEAYEFNNFGLFGRQKLGNINLLSDSFVPTSIAVSDSGMVVAIGSSLDNRVVVMTYVKSTNDWLRVGPEMVGESSGDGFGSSVAMDGNGIIVAVGAPSHASTSLANDKLGHVRVFALSSSSFVNGNTDISWDQMGQSLEGEEVGDGAGVVALSADGKTVAVGASNNNNNKGHVRVFAFRNDDNVWQQLGSAIVGPKQGDFSGSSVALSDDGRTVVIAAHNGNLGTGHVRVFEYHDGDWVQTGADLVGNTPQDAFGADVAVSADGSVVAVGATEDTSDRTATGEIQNAVGYVEVYQRPSV